MKILITCFLLFLSVNAQMLTRTKALMGTFISISLEKNDKCYFNDAFRILNNVDKSLSSYNKKSPVYRLNENKKVQLDKYSYEALSLSQIYYKKSHTYFNIAIGAITKDLYRFGEEQRLASKEALLNSNSSFNDLKFTKTHAKISKNIKLDLGGMGKGFGVDKVAEYLKDKFVSKAIIALSGDIRCLHKCNIDINDPFSEKPLISFKTINKDTGISTSGNYNRYVKSTRNNHLINPKTKASQQNFISITLISNLPSSALDAYATASSVMPKTEAYDFLNSLNLAYIILESDKSLHISDNLNLFVENTRTK